MSTPTQEKRLSLFHYPSCPYCAVTRKAVKAMQLSLQQKDVLAQPKYRQELIAGGGKAQVPCLKIEHGNGKIDWLYESRDIIHYLATQAESSNTMAKAS